MALPTEIEKLLSDYLDKPTVARRDKLFKYFYPLLQAICVKRAVSISRNMDAIAITPDELEAFGYYGFLDALSKIKREHIPKFRSYLCMRMSGAIIDGLRRTGAISRVEQYALEEKGVKNLQLSALYAYDDDSGEGYELEDPNVAYVPNLTSRLEREELIADIFDDIEDETVRNIFYRYYVDDMSMSAIGKEVGLCESRVSQLHKKHLAEFHQIAVQEFSKRGIDIPMPKPKEKRKRVRYSTSVKTKG